MQLYYHLSPATNYIYLFTAEKIVDKYAYVGKPIFEFAVDKPGEKRMFTPHGEKIFIGTKEPVTEDYAQQFLIDTVFNGDYDFPSGTIYRNDL